MKSDIFRILFRIFKLQLFKLLERNKNYLKLNNCIFYILLFTFFFYRKNITMQNILSSTFSRIVFCKSKNYDNFRIVEVFDK